MEKLKKIVNALIAKVLFVYGWIWDLCMKALNAVSKTPIETDKERRDVRVKQFAVASIIFYCASNSCLKFIIKSLHKVMKNSSFISSHFMPWDIILPTNIQLFILLVLLSLIVGLGASVKLHTLYRMKNDSKNIKGDNKFMTENELAEHFYPVKMDDISSAEKAGLLIGEKDGVYYIEPDTFNTMIVGATRSGKDECFVLPSMRLMANSKAKPSIIANDMKGEMLEQTYTEFVRNGYKVLVLDLIDTDHSLHWDPLFIIKSEYISARESDGDLSDTSKLVESYAHCLTDDEKSEAVWTDSSRSLLCAMIYYFLDRGYEMNKMQLVNMFSIYNFFLEFGTYNTVITEANGQKRMANALDELFSKLPTGSLAKLAYTTSKFSEGETRSSIFTVLSSKLAIFGTDMGIQKITAFNDIDFNDLTNEERPCIIYLVTPHEEKSRHIIASIFIDQCYMMLAKNARNQPNGKYKRRIEFFLNEFGQMPLIHELSQKLNVCAGCNILFNLFLQDLGQLKRYKNEEDSISGGCGIQIYINSLSNKTNKYFSEGLGNKTVDYLTFSGDVYGFLNHQGERVDGKALLDASQLSRLKFGSAVVKKQRCDPINTVITPYFKIKDKPARIPRMQIPLNVSDCSLDTILFPLDSIWDDLGDIGLQYRLDQLQHKANEYINKQYAIMSRIRTMQENGDSVPESMYTEALEYEKKASAAQRDVFVYQEEMKNKREFRENEKRKIFADAYGESFVQTADDGDEEYVDDYVAGSPYEYGDERSYTDAEAAVSKLNMLTSGEFQYYLDQSLYTDLRAYVKKIQKRPTIRSNFTDDEWAAVEKYINDEEMKYADT